MGITFTTNFSEEKLNRALRVAVMGIMQQVIKQAVEDMQRFTATRPSAKSGKEGRVDEGTMLESIAGESFYRGADEIVGRFGFLNRTELYFWLQTVKGFQHLGGDFIKPTMAMDDAYRIAIENLTERLK